MPDKAGNVVAPLLVEFEKNFHIFFPMLVQYKHAFLSSFRANDNPIVLYLPFRVYKAPV